MPGHGRLKGFVMLSRMRWMALVLWLGFASLSAMDMNQHPDQAIRDTIERVRQQIQQERASFQARPEQLYDLVESEFMPHIDSRYIAQLVLGRHWPGASESQRTRFISALKDHLMYSHALSLLEYEDTAELHWQPVPSAADTTDVVVPMEVIRSNTPPVRVNFSVRLVGTEWKIYDVNTGGISMVTNFRGQFNAVIRKEGLDALIARLAEHTRHKEDKVREKAKVETGPTTSGAP
jgi:phospholipid transport system substrate-binding protein